MRYQSNRSDEKLPLSERIDEMSMYDLTKNRVESRRQAFTYHKCANSYKKMAVCAGLATMVLGGGYSIIPSADPMNSTWQTYERAANQKQLKSLTGVTTVCLGFLTVFASVVSVYGYRIAKSRRKDAKLLEEAIRSKTYTR